MQVVQEDFGHHLYRTDRHSHHQLTRDEIRNHYSVDGTDNSPGNRLKQTFGIAVLTGLGGEELFGELI